LRRLDGKIVVVAGGRANIGAATAMRLAEEGAAVVIGARTLDGANSVAERIVGSGSRATGAAFDALDEDSIKALVATAVQTYGGLDAMLVNMADLSLHSRDTDAVDVPLEVFDRAIAVNLRAHLVCTRYAVTAMLKRGGGSIVYTSSSAAFMGRPVRVSYAVTKHALTALMRHVATRWGKEGIRANIVAPGLVMSEKNRNHPEKARVLENTHSPRLGEPEDIAAMVAMLMSRDGEWINGQVICVDGGVTMR
jgi:NAD(P)-dependent dehydrogenase (short-subunit alcohol dehydrogenase family)